MAEMIANLSKLELEAEFNNLAEEWRAETGMLSLVTQKSMHPAYQKIISMGRPVVPLILRDLEYKKAVQSGRCPRARPDLGFMGCTS
jgi:hypothetical protein